VRALVTLPAQARAQREDLPAASVAEARRVVAGAAVDACVGALEGERRGFVVEARRGAEALALVAVSTGSPAELRVVPVAMAVAAVGGPMRELDDGLGRGGRGRRRAMAARAGLVVSAHEGEAGARVTLGVEGRGRKGRGGVAGITGHGARGVAELSAVGIGVTGRAGAILDAEAWLLGRRPMTARARHGHV